MLIIELTNTTTLSR